MENEGKINLIPVGGAIQEPPELELARQQRPVAALREQFGEYIKSTNWMEEAGVAPVVSRTNLITRGYFAAYQGMEDILTADERDDFNPAEHYLPEDKSHEEDFSEAKSLSDMQRIRERISIERDADIYAMENPWKAAGLMIGAAVLDPVQLMLPGGAAIASVRAGVAASGVLRGAGLVGAITGTVAAAQAVVTESIFHAMEETRTAEQSAYAVGGSFLLGSILGFGGNTIGRTLFRGDGARANIDNFITDTVTPKQDVPPMPLEAAVPSKAIEAVESGKEAFASIKSEKLRKIALEKYQEKSTQLLSELESSTSLSAAGRKIDEGELNVEAENIGLFDRKDITPEDALKQVIQQENIALRALGQGGDLSGATALRQERLAREGMVKFLGGVAGLRGFIIGGKETASPTFGLATSASVEARRFLAGFADSGLVKADERGTPVVPVASTIERETQTKTANMMGKVRSSVADFQKEILQKGEKNTKEINAEFARDVHLAVVTDGARKSRFAAANKLAADLIELVKDYQKKATSTLGKNGKPLLDLQVYDATGKPIEGKFQKPLGAINYFTRSYNQRYIKDNHNKVTDFIKSYYRGRHPEWDEDRLTDAATKTIDNIKGGSARGQETGNYNPWTNIAESRKLDIPDEVLIDAGLLVSDPVYFMSKFIRTMESHLGLWERYGSLSPADEIKKIRENYDLIKASMKDNTKALKNAEKQLENDRYWAEYIWDRALYRGTIDSDPVQNSTILYRIMRVQQPLQNMATLKIAPLRNIFEVMNPIFQWGFGRSFRNTFNILSSLHTDLSKASKAELRQMGLVLDTITSDIRAQAQDEVGPSLGHASYLERKVMSGNALYQKWIDWTHPWNDAVQSWAGRIANNEILRIAEKAVGKGMSKADSEMMRELALDSVAMQEIGRQFTKHGKKANDYRVSFFEKWDNKEASRAFQDAVYLSARRVQLNPKYETPTMFTKSIPGKVLGNFMGIMVSTYQKEFLAGMQRHHATALAGMIGVVALGTLRGMIDDALNGREKGRSFEELVAMGVVNSGVLSYYGDLGMRMQGYTTGKTFTESTGGLYAQYQNNLVKSAVGVPKGLYKGEMSKGAISATSAIIPGRRIAYTQWLFNQLEDEARKSYGHEEKYQ